MRVGARGLAVGGLASALLGICWPVSGKAQVIEIGEAGNVRVYDGPAVFTTEGARPITPTPVPAAPAPRAGSAIDRAAIASAAQAAYLSPALVEAVAWRESGLRPDAVSRAGAIGVMQLMPGTARALGVDPTEPGQNLRGGAVYLNALLRHYDGDLTRALAAYNAGPKVVDRYGGVPPYKETQAYVASILERLSRTVDAPSSGSTK